MGISNLFAAGGVVMFPLLAFSVVAIALIVERIRQIAFMQEYSGQLELLYRRRYERGEKSYATTR
jgi:biopolymer transport protein ExbB/TolQ